MCSLPGRVLPFTGCKGVLKNAKIYNHRNFKNEKGALVDMEFQTYPMPNGTEYRQKAKWFRELREDSRYQQARNCRYCTDTADCFGRYISTYCHLRQENIAGMGKDLLDRCAACKHYERRA